jgi:hypothetical protein
LDYATGEKGVLHSEGTGHTGHRLTHLCDGHDDNGQILIYGDDVYQVMGCDSGHHEGRARSTVAVCADQNPNCDGWLINKDGKARRLGPNDVVRPIPGQPGMVNVNVVPKQDLTVPNWPMPEYRGADVQRHTLRYPHVPVHTTEEEAPRRDLSPIGKLKQRVAEAREMRETFRALTAGPMNPLVAPPSFLDQQKRQADLP